MDLQAAAPVAATPQSKKPQLEEADGTSPLANFFSNLLKVRDCRLYEV